jgi:hypothetical protein
MSKVDAQRAMREAKYASNRAAGPKRGEAPAAGASAPAARPPVARTQAAKPARTTAAAPTATGGALCGHKSMNGRACTREAGHSEKNHRYS